MFRFTLLTEAARRPRRPRLTQPQFAASGVSAYPAGAADRLSLDSSILLPRSVNHRRFQLSFAAVLAIATGLVGWQLFVPPIIGLADQGDFVRLLGPLGYAPVPKGPEHKYLYLTRFYVSDPSYRQPRWEQLTSEFLPARIAVAFNALSGNRNTFDITIFGAVHALLFLLAFSRLLWVTRGIRNRWLIWGLLLLVLTDVGYVAYWNSLYTEPASCLWFLFLLAESIESSNRPKISFGASVRWSLFAVLWICAKSQNAPLAVPLVLYAAGFLRRACDRRALYATVTGILVIVLAGVTMYRSLQPATRVTALYNMIFFGILPHSPDPQADLHSLGLNPDYAKYSGTLAWSSGTGIADGALVNAIEARIDSFPLMLFYLKRPGRMWQHVQMLLPDALSLRPEFCGNFEKAAGRPPGERSRAIALWSWLHENCLSRIAVLLLAGLTLMTAGGSYFVLRNRGSRWTQLGVCLAACCLTAFVVAAFGDAWDNVKHLFLFNLLLDACLVFGWAAALAAAPRWSERAWRRYRRSASPL